MADSEMDSIVTVVRWASLMVALVCALLAYGCYISNYAPVKDGMCQGSTPGVAGWVWVKCVGKP